MNVNSTEPQIVLICYAWFCALTRVSDYKHHPSDVMAGAVLGTVVALAFSSIVTMSRPAQTLQVLRGEETQELKSETVNV